MGADRIQVFTANDVERSLGHGGTSCAVLVYRWYTWALYGALELDPDHIDARAEEIGFLIRAPGIVGGDRDVAQRRIAELRSLAPREGSLAAADVLVRAGATGQAVAMLESYLAEFGDQDVPVYPTRAEVERRLSDARAELARAP